MMITGKHQCPEAVGDCLEPLPPAGPLGDGKVLAAHHDPPRDHQRRAHDQAGHDAGEEQLDDGNSAYDPEYDEAKRTAE